MSIPESFILHKLTIHFISKKPQQPIQLQLNKEVFNNEEARQLAWRIMNTYHSKNALERTVFKKDFKSPFQTTLDEYLNRKSPGENFLDFSSTILNILETEMKKKPAAAGGYFIIADVTLKYRYICIAIINEKKEYQSKNLVLTPVKVLDVDKLAVAAFINIDIYKKSLIGEDNRHYISFVKGIRKVADYFFDFLGASYDRISTKKQTEELVRAIEDFINEKIPEHINPYQLKTKIHDELKELHKNKQSISINYISSIIYPEKPNLFKEFVQSPENHYDLDSELDKLDIQIINKLTTFKYKGDHLSISFDKEKYQDKVKIESDGVKIIDEELKNQLIEEGWGDPEESEE